MRCNNVRPGTSDSPHQMTNGCGGSTRINIWNNGNKEVFIREYIGLPDRRSHSLQFH